jgi:thymidylate synthase (FAD)
MSEFDIKQYFKSLNVLDHGSIELVDAMNMDPLLKVVKSARVSFLSDSAQLEEKDLKLIKYLKEHEHFSTFRHSYFTFRVKAPLMVFRQWWKYQVGSSWEEREEPETNSIVIPETNWNEQSFRYTVSECEFYVPSEIRKQSKSNKQGSEGRLEEVDGKDPVEIFRSSCLRQFADYEMLVKAGAAKEQCRMLLPQNVYSSCYWTCSLQTILFFLHQRLKNDAQWEIRQYALALKQLISPMLKNAFQLE